MLELSTLLSLAFVLERSIVAVFATFGELFLPKKELVSIGFCFQSQVFFFILVPFFVYLSIIAQKSVTDGVSFCSKKEKIYSLLIVTCLNRLFPTFSK